MLYEGQLVLSDRVCCISCGEPTHNMLPPSSAFIRYGCRSEKCDMNGVCVTIEKCSNSIFSLDPHFVIDGEYAWPKYELVNLKGDTVWPKKETPKDVQ